MTHLTYHSALVSYHILHKRDLVLRVEDGLALRDQAHGGGQYLESNIRNGPFNRAIVVVGILINMRLIINILYASMSPVDDSSEKR